MAIAVGDRLPEVILQKMGPKGPRDISTQEIFSGKKVVLFALPGAFTPTCSAVHLPGFIDNSDKLLARGVDEIICLSVNDAFVMDTWGKQANAEGVVTMLADGSAKFTKAIGLDWDLSDRGFGLRSQRYAMIVDDGTVTHLKVEAPGKFEVSDADTVLGLL